MNQTSPVRDKEETWKALESLVYKIQKQTAPDATVIHDHRVVGRSGVTRRLDVTVSKKVGLNRVLIVLECKRWSRPVDMEEVEAFASKLRDVRASVGVMVSARGFTKGARKAAVECAITLQTLREAEESDWQAIVQDQSWMGIRLRQERIVKLTIELERGIACDAPEDLILYSDSGPLGRLADLRNDISPWDPEERIGEFKVDRFTDESLHVSTKGGPVTVKRITGEGIGIAREYIINLYLRGGHVVEDGTSGAVVYRELESQPFDLVEIVERQEGRPLTSDEWANPPEGIVLHWHDPPIVLPEKRYWKLVVTQQAEIQDC